MFGDKTGKDPEVARIGKQILREHDLEIPVEYKGEMFVLKYPTPYLRSAIETEIARRLGGYARETYAPQHVAMVEAMVYVNELYVADKCPAWFKGAWTCYDEDLIQALYAGYLLFRNKFQEKIREDRFQGNSTGDSA